MILSSSSLTIQIPKNRPKSGKLTVMAKYLSFRKTRIKTGERKRRGRRGKRRNSWKKSGDLRVRGLLKSTPPITESLKVPKRVAIRIRNMFFFEFNGNLIRICFNIFDIKRHLKCLLVSLLIT